MRNEALTGYLLHQRPYQEKRALYYLFSEQHGVIHGIGKKGAPLFELLQLFATGKRDLKTFTQINLMPVEYNYSNSIPLRYDQISGQQQYAALYLNEVLWKLLPTEDPLPTLWRHYQDSLVTLKKPLTAQALRLCLRQFEQHLFQQLGFAISLTQDSNLVDIKADSDYRFFPDVGLVLVSPTDSQTENEIQTNTPSALTGTELLAMAQHGITEATLIPWSRLYRLLIDYLLDYQPLQSRLLWQQQQRYHQ